MEKDKLIKIIARLSACAVELENEGKAVVSKQVFMIVADLIDYLWSLTVDDG